MTENEKAKLEQELCSLFPVSGLGGISDLQKILFVSDLMTVDNHDMNRVLGKFLREAEFSKDLKRGENDFKISDAVSKTIHDGSYLELSSKAQGLCQAAIALAKFADIFELIEKQK